MTDDESDYATERNEWVRMECLRMAVTSNPKAEPEKQIELAMVYEWYVRGEIEPESPSEARH